MSDHAARGAEASCPRPGTIVAGIDIGNSTTEIVLGALSVDGLATAMAAARRPTTGSKGSAASLSGAAALLSELERTAGLLADVAVIADLAPAPVLDASWPARPPDAGLPLRIVRVADGATGAGAGAFAGRYALLDNLTSTGAGEPVVVGIGRHWDFEDAARILRDARSQGVPIAGVLVERDEAVLIGNRSKLDCPIIDTVALGQCREGVQVAGEAASQGSPIRRVADPVFLCRALGLSPDIIPRLPGVLSYLASRSVAVVTPAQPEAEEPLAFGEVTWRHRGDSGRLSLPSPAEVIARSVPPGTITAMSARPGTALAKALAACPGGIADLATLDVSGADSVPLALLASGAAVHSVQGELQELLRRPVIAGGSEARAAFAGALDTPGLPERVLVVDIGAGTLDVITETDSVVVAGAGHLITAGIAAALSIPATAAESAKMFPAVRVETPHLVAREDGVRVFLDTPATGASIGSLSLLKPDGELVPLGARQAPEEWQRIRLGIKATILERGLARATRMLREPPREECLVVLAGGGAEDHELAGAAARFARLGQVATADVAGRFGPRYAVAWGLVLTLAKKSEPAHLTQGEGI